MWVLGCVCVCVWGGGGVEKSMQREAPGVWGALRQLSGVCRRRRGAGPLLLLPARPPARLPLLPLLPQRVPLRRPVRGARHPARQL